MKIKGFLKDVGGASRVTARRKELFETASDKLVLSDPIGDVANALHPGSITLEVASITPASPTAKTIRFISKDKKLPVFQAGQYLSLKLNIGDTLTSRPYSISSAPFETRTDNPFVEITVRNKGESFASDYLYKSLKIGDNLSGTMPHGQFYFEELRDAKNIVAIAGGSGITPFISMAREIEHGTLDVNLTILYGSNEVSDIILKDRLDAIKSDRVRVVHVIANDPSWSGEKGFITSEIIKKYSAGDTTYFLCGPQVMCKFVLGELDKLHIAPRRIRREVFGAPREIENYEGYPESAKGKTFKLTLVRGIRKDIISARSDEPIIVAIERAGIKSETNCRSGECGFCRSELLSGEIFVCPDGDGRRMADKQYGFFHPCSSYPVSDLSVKIPIL